jgi:RNA polymerase sigma-70 factor (ECF subfamily)
MNAVLHEATWREAASGDDAALERLVRSYHDRVYRYGRRLCRDESDAEDAVQEAFATLARRRGSLDPRHVLSWLLVVVRNACLRILRPLARRRRALGVETDLGELPSSSLNPERALARWELIRAVHAAIAELDRPYREVLVLRDLEGLSGAETCEALGLTTDAMKTRLHRARQSLRVVLAAGAADVL